MPKQLPLCVDLDGTLIYTDILQEMMVQYIWKWPYKIVNLLVWWCRGRAYLKQKLATKITLDPTQLPVNYFFLDWLYQQQHSGRDIILVTASDQKPAGI